MSHFYQRCLAEYIYSFVQYSQLLVGRRKWYVYTSYLSYPYSIYMIFPYHDVVNEWSIHVCLCYEQGVSYLRMSIIPFLCFFCYMLVRNSWFENIFQVIELGGVPTIGDCAMILRAAIRAPVPSAFLKILQTTHSLGYSFGRYVEDAT